MPEREQLFRLGDTVRKKTVRAREVKQSGDVIGIHTNPILPCYILLVLWEDGSQSFERDYELKEDA